MIFRKNYNLSLIKQVFRFGGVGLSALILHWCTVLILVSFWEQRPLVANAFAFLLAFQLSYWGHRHWTFQGSSLSHKKSLFRFLLVAIFGFILNQTLFSALLSFSNLPYPIALLIVLIIVSFSTFIFSKFWAFRLRA